MASEPMTSTVSPTEAMLRLGKYRIWGCTNSGGCLNQANDNCSPACGGVDCDTGAGFIDCPERCPNANCTTHTPCAMDSGGTLNYCPTTLRQIGWVDTDGDGALDCLRGHARTIRMIQTTPQDASINLLQLMLGAHTSQSVRELIPRFR